MKYSLALFRTRSIHFIMPFYFQTTRSHITVKLQRQGNVTVRVSSFTLNVQCCQFKAGFLCMHNSPWILTTSAHWTCQQKTISLPYFFQSCVRHYCKSKKLITTLLSKQTEFIYSISSLTQLLKCVIVMMMMINHQVHDKYESWKLRSSDII